MPGACYPHTKEASTGREGMTQGERDEPLEPMESEEEREEKAAIGLKEATPVQDAGDQLPLKAASRGLSKGWDMKQNLRRETAEPEGQELEVIRAVRTLQERHHGGRVPGPGWAAR